MNYAKRQARRRIYRDLAGVVKAAGFLIALGLILYWMIHAFNNVDCRAATKNLEYADRLQQIRPLTEREQAMVEYSIKGQAYYCSK